MNNVNIFLIILIYVIISIIIHLKIRNKNGKSTDNTSYFRNSAGLLVSYQAANSDALKTKREQSLSSIVGLIDNFKTSFQQSSSSIIYNDDDKNNNIFPECDIMDNNPNCLILNNDVYDEHTRRVLLSNGKKRRRRRRRGYRRGNLFPNASKIPKTCGFGILLYNRETESYKCQCHSSEYLTGDHCDDPGPTLTRVNKCSKIAESTDIDNTDVSTFHPLLEGICVECSVKSAVPIIGEGEPKCLYIIIDF